MPALLSLSLRVGAIAALFLLSGTSEPWAQEKVGINSAVNPDATGTPPNRPTRQLVIGQEVVFNEQIKTGPLGQTQLLFLDESSMSIGPNSDLTIDQFVFDPKTGTGKQAMSATRGLLRYVGGKLSKQDSAVTLRTSTATLAVRGGAFMVNILPNGTTEAIFIYGKGLTVTGLAGGSVTINRVGYGTTTAPGGQPSPPAPPPPGTLGAYTAALDGRPGGTGGATNLPEDATVVASGLSQTVSGDITQSVEQSTQNTGTGTGTGTSPTGISFTAPTIITNQLQSTINQPVTCQETNTCPPPPPPVTVTYAGRAKNTNGKGTALGFVDQSAAGDIAFSAGALSGGIFTANVGALGTVSFPLVPGAVSFVNGSSTTLGTLSGTSVLAADGTFFYANLTPNAQLGERVFISGGLPVNSAALQPTGNTRIFAFSIQPDAALQSNIPFVRTQAGGGLPNATVSPLYVAAPPTTSIGNATTVSAARALQASLAVNGPGANQQSTIAVTTGTFGVQTNGKPILAGHLRGSSLPTAADTPVRIGSKIASTVDGAGTSIYGGAAISGFVLDQTQFNETVPGSGVVTTPGTPSTANEMPLSGTTTNYGFAQPVLPVAVPNGVGASRTTQALSGNFGGLMYTTAQTNPYVVTGGTLVSTDAPNNNIQATLSGSAQSTSAGVSTLVMEYGGLTGAAGARQAFIDNNTFGVLESQVNPQQITIGGTTSQPTGQLYLVSSGAAGTPASLLPSGVSYCQCQFLQWGYWGGDLTTAGAAPRVDRGHINTWVAGVPTPAGDLTTLANQAVNGTYTGHAIGSVFNNGSSYLATGGFTGTYNFATQNGTMTISNFDGNPPLTTSGKAPLTGANYSFAVNGGGLKANINGTFYGPLAAETGGSFAVQRTVGPTYIASGIFAGKR